MENPTHIFTGRIHPERAAVGPLHVSGDMMYEETAVPFELYFGASQVLIQTSGDGGASLATLKNRVSHLAQRFSDAITWSNGCAYKIEIVSAISPEGHSVFGVEHPIAQREPRDAQKEGPRAIAVLLGPNAKVQRRFARALADYRQSILEPDDTAELCWRAVESLSYTFERNNRKGMDELAEVLRISRAWIRKNLEIPAGELRHGKVVAVTSESRDQALRSAQAVIDRFILLQESGSDRLGDAISLLQDD